MGAAFGVQQFHDYHRAQVQEMMGTIMIGLRLQQTKDRVLVEIVALLLPNWRTESLSSTKITTLLLVAAAPPCFWPCCPASPRLPQALRGIFRGTGPVRPGVDGARLDKMMERASYLWARLDKCMERGKTMERGWTK